MFGQSEDTHGNRKWQMWLHGSTLIGETYASTKAEALDNMREQAQNLGYNRLPSNSIVTEISEDYYRNISRSNIRQGFLGGRSD